MKTLIARKLHLMRFLFTATLMAVAAGAVHAQTLRLGHVVPPSHVWNQVAEKIGVDLKQASNGKFSVSVQPLGRLGNESQMITLMQSGAMPLGILTVPGLSNRVPSFQAWSLPYVFRDVKHAAAASKTPAAREILAQLDAHGLVGLGYVQAGMRHILSVDPARTPADLANRKVRAFPNPLYNDWYQALGTAPTALPTAEIATSLTTRLVHAIDTDLDLLNSFKFHQQASNLMLTHHMAFPGAIVVSKKFWEARSPAERELIARIVGEAETWGIEQAINAESTNLEAVKADGVKIMDIDVAAFEAVADKVRRKYTDSDPLIARLKKEAEAL